MGHIVSIISNLIRKSLEHTALLQSLEYLYCNWVGPTNYQEIVLLAV